MKELTLENVQVDCRELTEEQIKEMTGVIGDKLSFFNQSFDLDKGRVYFSFNKHCYLFGFYDFDKEQYEITYEKFMELFTDQVEMTSSQVADIGKNMKGFIEIGERLFNINCIAYVLKYDNKSCSVFVGDREFYFNDISYEKMKQLIKQATEI